MKMTRIHSISSFLMLPLILLLRNVKVMLGRTWVVSVFCIIVYDLDGMENENEIANECGHANGPLTALEVYRQVHSTRRNR